MNTKASKYPFASLTNVGDNAEFSTDTTVNAVRVAACLYGKRHGVKLRVREIEIPDCHIGNHFRVERVA